VKMFQGDGFLCNSVQQTRDGGYIIGGYTMPLEAEGNSTYLIKTDANGDVN
jgi:hypothetical protein